MHHHRRLCLFSSSDALPWARFGNQGRRALTVQQGHDFQRIESVGALLVVIDFCQDAYVVRVGSLVNNDRALAEVILIHGSDGWNTRGIRQVSPRQGIEASLGSAIRSSPACMTELFA